MSKVSLSLFVEQGYYHTGITPGKINQGAKSLMSCFAYKVGYSCSLNLEILNLYILAFSMTNGEIILNSIRKPLLFALPNTIVFDLECNMSCLQSIFVTHVFLK